VTVNDIRNAISLYYSTAFLGMAETRLSEDSHSWIRIMLTSDVKENTFDPTVIFVTNKDGALIRLDQLVKVIHAEQEPLSYYRINGLNSIYLSLTAEESANQLRLSKEVKKTIDRLRQSLPPGYEIYINYDATDYIQAELNKIYFRSCLTILILL